MQHSRCTHWRSDLRNECSSGSPKMRGRGPLNCGFADPWTWCCRTMGSCLIEREGARRGASSRASAKRGRVGLTWDARRLCDRAFSLRFQTLCFKDGQRNRNPQEKWVGRHSDDNRYYQCSEHQWGWNMNALAILQRQVPKGFYGWLWVFAS